MKEQYFNTEDLELIAKIANLQLSINNEYSIMQSVVGFSYISPLTNEERVLTDTRDIKSYIDIYKINFDVKPEWANRILYAQKKFFKLKQEYTDLKKQLSGEYGSISINLQIYS